MSVCPRARLCACVRVRRAFRARARACVLARLGVKRGPPATALAELRRGRRQGGRRGEPGTCGAGRGGPASGSPGSGGRACRGRFRIPPLPPPLHPRFKISGAGRRTGGVFQPLRLTESGRAHVASALPRPSRAGREANSNCLAGAVYSSNTNHARTDAIRRRPSRPAGGTQTPRPGLRPTPRATASSPGPPASGPRPCAPAPAPRP